MTPRALAVAALSLLALPAVAHADGPPIGWLAPGGVIAGSVRYLALPAGSHGTVLEKLTLNGARPLRTRYLRGAVGTPMIASDGTAGGISGDGRTLVLGMQRVTYPQQRSTLYVMNTRNLSLRRRILLKGDFSYDAISPDGSTIYLIQLSPSNFLRYAVRAFDTTSWRLDPKPVVDRREPDEVMRGYPVTRLMSPGGRFAYTLYNGGEKPFVHALDTTNRSAACIDIPPIPDSAQLKLRLTGRRLTVVADGTPVAVVDTSTRHVWRPAQGSEAPVATTDGGGSDAGTWLLVAGAALALAGVAVLRSRRRRARTAA